MTDPTGGQESGDCDRFLRRKEVEYLTGLSRTTIYRHMKKGLFTQSVRIGPNAVAWRESEIRAWMADRPRANGAPEPHDGSGHLI